MIRGRHIALVVSLIGCNKLVTYEPPAEKRLAASEQKSFDDAKALATKGDLEGAHAKLREVPDDSALRSTQDFKDIEDRWAKDQIVKADKETDKGKKLAILEPVAKSPTVSGDLRAAASQKIELATPDPAIPPPLLAYDPVESEARLKKAKWLMLKKQGKAVIDLLSPPVLSGHASPDEREMLTSVCVSAKDTACTSALIDAGVVPASVFDAGPPPPKKK